MTIDKNEHLVDDGNEAEITVNIVRQLQSIASTGTRPWPFIPGLGALHPVVQNGRAVWVLSDGTMFCEIGQIFPDDADL